MKRLIIATLLTTSMSCSQFDIRSPAQDKETSDARLGQYTINMMYATPAGKKLSAGRKQSLAHSIVRVANDIFESEDSKRAFVAVIAIESGFQKYAQSPTGPRGYSQVAKAAFTEALASCGITDLNDEDVWDTDLNLYAGACYFQMLLIKHNQDPYMSIIAYNQGPNSESIKTFSKSGSLDNKEALKYVAKFAFLNRTVSSDKQPNSLAIQKEVATRTPKKESDLKKEEAK